jgi:hypothetical protein
MGGQGDGAPMARGLGDVPPEQKGGRAAHLSNPATSGTQNAGKPSAYRGGQMGVQGAQAPWRVAWGGVPPQIQRRGE